MRKTEAFDIIADFAEKIISPDNFEYGDIGTNLQKTREVIKEYPDMVKYVDSDFIKGLKKNYRGDFSLECVGLFVEIMKTKNLSEQKAYLQEIKGLNKNLREEFESYAVKENPELAEGLFKERLDVLLSQPVSPNNNPDLINLIIAAPTPDKCEEMLKTAFDEKVPEVYRNKNIFLLSSVYRHHPQTVDSVFEIIKNHPNSKDYFAALAHVAIFDEYKAEEALCKMHQRIQEGPVDEYLLQKYYSQMKIVSDTLPKFKPLAQEFCREALSLPQNSKNAKKLAARLLEDEEALYSQIEVGKEVAKSTENLFGYEKVNHIDPEEVCILFIGGNGTRDDKAAHGYIKPAIELLKKHNLDKCVKVYGTTYDFGDFFNTAQALDAQMKKYGHKTLHREENLENMHAETQDPQFVKQIFNQFILPRISQMNGKVKIPATEAARKINKLKIIAHCLGGYATLKLEEMSMQTMQKLGYTSKEQELIVGQMQVLAMNPYCPLGIQKSEMFSIISAQDRDVTHNNFFEKYIRKLVNKGKIIPLCYFDKKLGNFMLVNKMYGSDNRRNPEFDADEHNYFGLNIVPAFSEKGKIAMTFAQNYLINGLKSALKNELREVDTPKLLVANKEDLNNFDMAEKNGKALYTEIVTNTLAEQNKIFNKSKK